MIKFKFGNPSQSGQKKQKGRKIKESTSKVYRYIYMYVSDTELEWTEKPFLLFLMNYSNTKLDVAIQVLR